MREPREKDANVLYPETGEDRILRTEQEVFAKVNRSEPLGAKRVVSGKARNVFKNKKPSVKRMRTFKVNTDTKAWKDYLEKKITLQELKKLTNIA